MPSQNPWAKYEAVADPAAPKGAPADGGWGKFETVAAPGAEEGTPATIGDALRMPSMGSMMADTRADIEPGLRTERANQLINMDVPHQQVFPDIDPTGRAFNAAVANTPTRSYYEMPGDGQPSPLRDVLNKLLGDPDAVDPVTGQTDALLTAAGAREGMSGEQYRRELQGGNAGIPRYARDIGSGAIRTIEGIVNAAGGVADDSSLMTAAAGIGNYATDLMPPVAPGEQPSFGDQLAAGAGSTLTFFVPGLGIARGMSRMSPAVQKISAATGASVTTVLEAAAEAGNTYAQIRAAGEGDVHADAKAAEVFAKNLGLLYGTNRIGLFGDVGNKTQQTIGAGVGEGFQEVVQQGVQNQATGEDITEGAAESGAIGALVGAGMKRATTQGNDSDRIKDLLKGWNNTIQDADLTEGDAFTRAAKASQVEQPGAQATGEGYDAFEVVRELPNKGVEAPQSTRAAPLQTDVTEATFEGYTPPTPAQKRRMVSVREQQEELQGVALPPNYTDPRLSRAEHRMKLAQMPEALETNGGMVLAPKEGAKPTSNTGDLMYDYGADQLTRTASVNPEWFKGKGWTKAAVEKAVDNALTGKRMGARQIEIVNSLLDQVTADRKAAVPDAKEQRASARWVRSAFGNVAESPAEYQAIWEEMYSDAEPGSLLDPDEYIPEYSDEAGLTIQELGARAEQLDPDAYVEMLENLSAGSLESDDRLANELFKFIQERAANEQETAETPDQGTARPNADQGESAPGQAQLDAPTEAQAAEPFELDQQTEEGRRRQAAEDAQRNETEAQKAAAQAREESDGEFALTGSDRESDQAAAKGQEDLFAAPATTKQESPPEGMPREMRKVYESARAGLKPAVARATKGKDGRWSVDLSPAEQADAAELLKNSKTPFIGGTAHHWGSGLSFHEGDGGLPQSMDIEPARLERGSKAPTSLDGYPEPLRDIAERLPGPMRALLADAEQRGDSGRWYVSDLNTGERHHIRDYIKRLGDAARSTGSGLWDVGPFTFVGDGNTKWTSVQIDPKLGASRLPDHSDTRLSGGATSAVTPALRSMAEAAPEALRPAFERARVQDKQKRWVLEKFEHDTYGVDEAAGAAVRQMMRDYPFTEDTSEVTPGYLRVFENGPYTIVFRSENDGPWLVSHVFVEPSKGDLPDKGDGQPGDQPTGERVEKRIADDPEQLDSDKGELSTDKKPKRERDPHSIPDNEWFTGAIPDRSAPGMKYVIMVRADRDPERGNADKQYQRDWGDPVLRDRTRYLMGLAKEKPEQEEIREHLMSVMQDGEPRTFNHLGVDAFDRTADVLAGTPVEEAAWSLVKDGTLAFTQGHPVFFRLAIDVPGAKRDFPAESAEDTAAAAESAAEEGDTVFLPTHELADGTQVQAGDEPGLWIDESGTEIEDDSATPIGDPDSPASSAGASVGEELEALGFAHASGNAYARSYEGKLSDGTKAIARVTIKVAADGALVLRGAKTFPGSGITGTPSVELGRADTAAEADKMAGDFFDTVDQDAETAPDGLEGAKADKWGLIFEAAKVEKKGYSVNPWRILSEDGREISRPQEINHPDLGATSISSPFSYPTKREAVAALNRLRLMYPPGDTDTMPGDDGLTPQQRVTPQQRKYSNKLVEQAAAMHEKAKEKLNAPRLTNTNKRATQAQQASIDARNEMALADTIANVGHAISAGTAGPLMDIRNASQVKTLRTELRLALYRVGDKRSTGEYLDPATVDKDHAEQAANLANMPFFQMHGNRLQDLAKELREVPGAGNVAKQVEALVRKHGTNGNVELSDKLALAILAKGKGVQKLKWPLSDMVEQQQKINRLHKAGIKTNDQLRDALLKIAELSGQVQQEDKSAKLERDLVGTKIPGFFPTPPALAARMAGDLDIEPSHNVLDPSAGSGNLMDAARDAQPEAEIWGVEINSSLAELLESKGHNVQQGDFMEQGEGQLFDRIIMNPPYENNIDIEHVQHAYELLAPGGRMAALVGEGAFSRQGKTETAFREWLEEVDASVEKLPSNTFMDKSQVRTTGANARYVFIEKEGAPGAPARTEKGDRPAPGNDESLSTLIKYAQGRGWRPMRSIQSNKLERTFQKPVFDGKKTTHQVRVLGGAGQGWTIRITEGRNHNKGQLVEQQDAETLGEALDLAEMMIEELQPPEVLESRSPGARQSAKPASGTGGGVLAAAGATYVPLVEQLPYISPGATVQPARSTRDQVKRREDILETYLKDLGITMHQGRIAKRSRMLGFFRPFNRELRLKRHNDLEVAAHEIAHYLDYTNPELRKKWRKDPWRTELKGVSYDDKKVYEGFAEWMRLWMTQPTEAIARAPEWTKHFESWLENTADKKTRKAVNKAKENMREWFAQTPVARLESKIGGQALRMGLVSPLARFRQSTSDDLAGVLEMERALTDSADPMANGAYETARLTRAAVSIVDGALRHGQPVATFTQTPGGRELKEINYSGVSLEDVLAPLGEDLDDFINYAVSVSASELLEQGRENLLTKEEIEAGLALNNGRERGPDGHTDFERAFIAYQEWNKGIVDFAVSMGIIDPQRRAKWQRQMYIPFYRVTEPSAGRPSTKGGIEGNNSFVHRLTGGTGNLNDIVTNMVMNAEMLITGSLRNEARRRIASLASHGAGKGGAHDGGMWLAKIPKETKPQNVSVKQLEVKMLEAVGLPAGAADPNSTTFAMLSQEEQAVADQIKQYIEDTDNANVFWLMGQDPSTGPGDKVMAVLTGGEPTFFEVVDPTLWRSIQSLKRSDQHPLVRALDSIRRFGQASVTLSVDFMTANMVRDTAHGWAFSRGGFRPVLDSFRGFKSAITQDKMYQQWRSNGGDMASYLMDEHALRRSLEGFYARRGFYRQHITINPMDWLVLLEKASSAFEASTRLGEFTRAVERGDAPRHAAYLSREISSDFSMRGDSQIIGFMYDTVLFLKAAVNGIDRAARGFASPAERKLLGIKTAGIAMTSGLLYLINRGNPCYDDLPDWDKDAHWHVFIPGGPDGGNTQCEKDYMHFRIPKIWEIGAMASMTERMFGATVDAVAKEQGADAGKLARDMFRITADQMKLDFVPFVFAPLADVYGTNKDFTGRYIVAPHQEDLPPSMQSDAFTSPTFRAIGEASAKQPEGMRELAQDLTGNRGAFELSPKRMEALWRGYTNTMGLYAQMMVDGMFAEGKPDKDISQWPVARRFLGRAPRRVQATQDLYEVFNAAKGVHQAYNAGVKRMQPELAEVYAKDPRQMERGIANAAVAELRKLNQAQGAIYIDPKMPGDQKRLRLNEINEQKNQVALHAMKVIKQVRRKARDSAK